MSNFFLHEYVFCEAEKRGNKHTDHNTFDVKNVQCIKMVLYEISNNYHLLLKTTKILNPLSCEICRQKHPSKEIWGEESGEKNDN